MPTCGTQQDHKHGVITVVVWTLAEEGSTAKFNKESLVFISAFPAHLIEIRASALANHMLDDLKLQRL